MIYNFWLLLYPKIIELKRVVVFLKTEDDLLFLRLKTITIVLMLNLASFECFSKILTYPTNTFYCNKRNIFNLYKLIRFDLPIFTNIDLYTHLMRPISYHHSRDKVRLKNELNMTSLSCK